MTTATTPVERLARALDATAGLIAGVRDDQWGLPTPCADWDVGQVVDHLVDGNLRFAGLLSGGLAGEDPVAEGDRGAAYRHAGEKLKAAFARPGTMERTIDVPAGVVPGVVALHLRMVEVLVHGWDVARATGQPVTALPADLAEEELDAVGAQVAALPAGRSPFAPPRPARADAPAIDRLSALLGRALAPAGVGLGTNAHLFARPHRRSQLRTCFATVLGGAVSEAQHPAFAEPLLIVRLPAGGSISVEFTQDAPDDDLPRPGTWLELRADDPAGLVRSALDAGLTPVVHPGHAHYIALPGGQVFAVAPTAT